MQLSVVSAVLLVLVSQSQVEGEKQKAKIVIGVLTPRPKSDLYAGYTTAMEMALELATNRSDFQALFKNYEIELQEDYTLVGIPLLLYFNDRLGDRK